MSQENRRTELLSAATTVFSTRGYRASSITDIVSTAGVARGTFYLYFESKAQVFLAIADDFYDRLEQAVEQPDSDPSDALDGRSVLRGTFRRWLEFFHHNRHAAIVMVTDASAIDARFNRGITELRQTAISHFEGRLRSLQKRGVARTPVSPGVAAHLQLGMFEALVQAFVLHVAEPDLDALADAMADVAWNGISGGSTPPLTSGSVGLEAEVVKAPV
jgi:AcrR family transcriptional regulator